MPAPSHVRASVAVVVPAGQDGGAHCVPASYSWQPPAPSQKPVMPQPEVLCVVHWPFGSMPPAVIGLQAPSVPTSAHDMQLPLQAVMQQTPWAQNPLWQSPGAAQLAPGGRKPHDPLLQTLGVAQSASAVQVDLKARLPHLNGKQELCGGVTHAPAPSHADAGVSVLVFAGQLAEAHGVPCP